MQGEALRRDCDLVWLAHVGDIDFDIFECEEGNAAPGAAACARPLYEVWAQSARIARAGGGCGLWGGVNCVWKVTIVSCSRLATSIASKFKPIASLSAPGLPKKDIVYNLNIVQLKPYAKGNGSKTRACCDAAHGDKSNSALLSSHMPSCGQCVRPRLLPLVSKVGLACATASSGASSTSPQDALDTGDSGDSDSSPAFINLPWR